MANADALEQATQVIGQDQELERQLLDLSAKCDDVDVRVMLSGVAIVVSVNAAVLRQLCDELRFRREIDGVGKEES